MPLSTFSLKTISSISLLSMLLIVSCEKDVLSEKCQSSISGRILDRVTRMPLADVKVSAWGYGGSYGVLGDPGYIPFDTIITDTTGLFEFFSETNIPNWNINTMKYGYDFGIELYDDTECQQLTEDINLDQFATIIVSTIDSPAVNFDSLIIYTVPDLGLSYYEGYGNDRLNLLPNESGEMWYKPDPKGFIRYWFRNDPKGKEYDVKIDALSGDTIMFVVEM